jgi:hypothetical protein
MPYDIRLYITKEGKPITPDEFGNFNIDAPYSGLYDIYCVVSCDGGDDIESFLLNVYGDEGITIKRNRCVLVINIEKNTTQTEKYFTLKFTHTNDRNIEKTVAITQKAQEYGLFVKEGNDDIESVPLETIPPITYVNKIDQTDIKTEEEWERLVFAEKQKYLRRNYEQKEIKVIVQGGNQKYRVKSINTITEDEAPEFDSTKQYYKDDIVLYEETPYRFITAHSGEWNPNDVVETDLTTTLYQFDNGFKYIKDGNNFIIKNYGRTLMNDGDYYKVTFCHDNNSSITKDLLVKYKYDNIPVEATTSEEVVNSEASEELTTPSFSSMSLDFVETEVVQPSQPKVSRTVKVEGLTDGECVIYGAQKIVLPIEVSENGESSNLMVGGQSTAQWCWVSFDATNRNVILEVKQKPISERKSMIKIYLIDFPNIASTFILKNVSPGNR